MKKSIIIAVMLLVLAGTAFTAVHNNRQPKGKTNICCKKANSQKPDDKKISSPVYLPVVNFF